MRVVPIGRAVGLQDDERDGVYLAALVVTPEWACITAGSWTRDPGGGVRDRMWFCEFTATDDTGTSYKMGYNGAGTPQIQAGPFELAPQPPADVRWLDVTPGPGRPAVRADLTAPAGPVQVTREEGSMAAAGLVLHRAANRMLAYWEPDRRIVNSQLEGFGATVAALAEAGGLPADSPLPGQLAALCERLGVTGHGITAAPRHDLPESWRSVAAYHLGENPGAGTHAASAPVAVVLPELDGVRYAVAGLHTGYGQTWLHVLAYGTVAGGIDPRAATSWWLRDDTGQWHVAVVTAEGENYRQLLVVPPVTPGSTALDLVVAGQAARARAQLPLTWWSPPGGSGTGMPRR